MPQSLYEQCNVVDMSDNKHQEARMHVCVNIVTLEMNKHTTECLSCRSSWECELSVSGMCVSQLLFFITKLCLCV